MKWSWKIGKLAGIDLYMHATFLLLIAWVAASHYLAGRSVADMATGVAFILVLFACVVLHELGHALTARHFGIPTRDITLLPIGGVARLERMPEQPKQEFLVAIAGPLVNVGIAAVLGLALFVTGRGEQIGALSLSEGSFTQRVLMANIALVVFNMIPAFPMDGGRILRALLAMRMPYVRATKIAGGFGQAFALLFGFIGLFANPMLLLVALFVWIGATQETAATQVKAAFQGIPVSAAMMSDFRTLTMTDTLANAVELVLNGSQQDFPVVEGGEVVGVLTRSDLLVALSQHHQNYPVIAAMRRDFRTLDSADMLDELLPRLSPESCRTFPVLDNGRLAGIVTLENVGEFYMIQNAIQKRNGAGGPIPQTPEEALRV